ncbi:MAG: SURF1 family protein [Caldilineaceae bacterium]
MTQNSSAPYPHDAPVPDMDVDGPLPGEGEPGLGEALRGFFSGTWATLPKLLNRTWWWVTLLVLLGMAFLTWLGMWQLDRLEQRRAFNLLVAERYNQPPYDLEAQGLPASLKELEWRRVEANGAFDFEHQVILTNQPGPNGEPGVRLITPLVFGNGQAVLVSRGWVAQVEAEVDHTAAFDEPDGAQVVGLIQESQTIENAPAPEGFQREWYRLDVPAIANQMPYPLLPAFLMQLPEAGRRFDARPVRDEPPVLDEGSHLSYAIQWFMFAIIFGFGYIQYVRWQEERWVRQAAEATAQGQIAQDQVAQSLVAHTTEPGSGATAESLVTALPVDDSPARHP